LNNGDQVVGQKEKLMNTLAKPLLLFVCCVAAFSGCRLPPNEALPPLQTVVIMDLTINDIGRPIVVVAKTPTMVVGSGSPPPPGLITTKGDTTVYKGQLSQIVEGGIMVRAPFPETPDTFKAVGIMAKNIKSIKFTE
jgi:hypothetical protein